MSSSLAVAPRRPSELRPPAARSTARSRARSYLNIPALAVLMILAGAFAGYVSGDWRQARVLWEIGLIGAGLPVVWRTVRGMLHGKFAADLVASLSIVTAAVIGEPLPASLSC